MKHIRYYFIFSFVLFNNTFSQWSDDPYLNLQICDVVGEQSVPKIKNTTDGKCYISWYDNRSGSYAMYLQLLNSLGEKQFGEDGLLVSDNPQDSWIVDHDLCVDNNNNAIVSFCDIRSGSTFNPFIYKISSTGNFLWGENGITLSNDFDVFQAAPKVASTNDGGCVVIWIYSSTPNKVAIQKISNDGNLMWGDVPIFLSGVGSENFTYPNIVSSNEGNVIAMWSGYSGSFLNPQNYRIYSQKFSPNGLPMWSEFPETVYSLGRVAGFFSPKIFSDGNDGVFYVWQDDRDLNNLTKSYVQHFSSNGENLFPIDGVSGSSSNSSHSFDAAITYVSSTNETFMFWKEANSLQSAFGIYGQKFSSDGTTLWNEFGKPCSELNQNSYSSISANAFENNAIVYFNELIFGSVIAFPKIFKINSNSEIEWEKHISYAQSEKLRLLATVDENGTSKIIWQDKRNDESGIYGQRINIDGSYGNPLSVSENNFPNNFSLQQNYPNPFNPKTKILFSLTSSKNILLKIYDVLGNEVATLIDNEFMSNGNYEIEFNGNNLQSGVYYYKLTMDNFSETKTMILIK